MVRPPVPDFRTNKHDLMALAKQHMEQEFPLSSWSTRQKVAATCRILFRSGHDSVLAGQITARADRDGGFYTQRLGLGFDEVTADNLLQVDENLNVLAGQGMANPANRFHSHIYRARADVRCIVHTHPMHVCALSMLGMPLKVAHMDACALFDEVAFLQEWPGVPVGNEEGELIAAALGGKRAAILAHHGLVVACASVEEACVIAFQCERAAAMQLLASKAGVIHDIDPVLAREAHDWLLQPSRVNATFSYLARRS